MFRVIWKERCPQGILTSVLYLVDISGRRDVHKVSWHLYCTLWTSLEGEMSTRYLDICTVPCGHLWKERCPQGILTSVLYLVDISRRRDVHKVSWHLYCTLWTSLEGEMSTRYLDICTVPGAGNCPGDGKCHRPGDGSDRGHRVSVVYLNELLHYHTHMYKNTIYREQTMSIPEECISG